MRNKKKRSLSGAQELASNERERPMSWEGELSDSEMVIDTSVNNGQYSIILEGAVGVAARAARTV